MQEEFVRWKLHAFTGEKRLSKSDCTNRTSLRKSSYATKYSTYTSTSGNYQNAEEGYRRQEKGNRSIWNCTEVSRKRESSP